MVGQRFNVERTPAGQQLVIPGAEQVSPKTHLTRLFQKPLRPRVGQRGLAGTSLFGKGGTT